MVSIIINTLIALINIFNLPARFVNFLFKVKTPDARIDVFIDFLFYAIIANVLC